MTYMTAQLQSLRANNVALRDTVSRWLHDYAEARCRRDQMRAMQRKSDAELAALGLRRDQIARHVFANRVWG